MTQAELAERLRYSDKAVSKWERGESVPDIAVLKAIADLFLVSVDYLISEYHEETIPPALSVKRKKRSQRLIVLLGILLVWLVATVAFVSLNYFYQGPFWSWLLFVYAAPLSFAVWLVFNTVWFLGRRNTLIVSGLIWTALASAHLTLLCFGISAPLLYVLGAPAEGIVFLWFRLRHRGF